MEKIIDSLASLQEAEALEVKLKGEIRSQVRDYIHRHQSLVFPFPQEEEEELTPQQKHDLLESESQVVDLDTWGESLEMFGVISEVKEDDGVVVSGLRSLRDGTVEEFSVSLDEVINVEAVARFIIAFS